MTPKDSRPVRMGLWRLVAYNLLRKPGRSVTAALAVVLVSATAFAGVLISQGVGRALDVGLARLGADLMVVPAQGASAAHTALVVGEPVSFYMDGALAGRVAAVDGVRQVSPQVYVETMANSACCTGRIFLVGFDLGSDFTVQPWLDQKLGRSLAPDEIIVGNHVLVLTGDEMKFYGSDFRVAGRLDATGMGMDETVFLPASAVSKIATASLTLAEKPLTIPDGQISALLVRLADRSAAEAVAQRIRAEVPGVSVLTGGQIARDVGADLRGLMTWVLPVATGGIGVVVLLFLALFSSVATERAREIGLLRAMGATVRQAAGVLVGEAVWLGLLGGLSGVAAGLAGYAIFQNKILFSYTLPFLWPGTLAEVLAGVAVVLGSGLLAGLSALYPALRIANMEPHHAIHAGLR